MSIPNLKKVVVVDGCRTPFLRSGTDYKDLMSYQLGQAVLKELLKRTGLDPAKIDKVIMGTVISNVQTSNVARESALTAGIPYSVPAHTVTMACISANQAITDGVNYIQTGHGDIVVAGGTDSVSDIPILFRKKMRQKLFAARSIKGMGDMLKFVLSLSPADFKPEAPSISEFTTRRTMGQDCDILASRYKVSREAQDQFAVRSHLLAAKAVKEGHLGEEIVPVEIPPSYKIIREDNGIRGNTTIEKMRSLQPAFVKKYGTLTAANSSFLTDGAAVVLLMSEEKAKELGLKPKAYVHSYTYTAQNPEDELLLGPAYSTARLLAKTGLSLNDMAVFEIHEAFAGQVLANLQCLNSDDWCRQKAGLPGKVGEIPENKLNLWGGSLSLGHPFGATGARLVTTAANRLIKENGKYALLASCAAGAHGHAMILEKY